MADAKTMEDTEIFDKMVCKLAVEEKQWLRTRFVDNLSLMDTEKLYKIDNGATYEQQIMRKLRRIPISEQLQES